MTVSSPWPRLTHCFQSTVLVYIPAAFLFLSCSAYFPYLANQSRIPCVANTPLSVSKTVISIALVSLAVAAAITEVFTSMQCSTPTEKEFLPMTYAALVAKGTEVACYATTVLIVQLEKNRCIVTSGVLFIYWLILFVVDLIPLMTYIKIEMYLMHPSRFVSFVVSIFLIGAQLVLNSYADKRLFKEKYTLGDNYCPELKASFLSRILFVWITRLLCIGYKRPLKALDLWDLKSRDSCKNVLAYFEEAKLLNFQRKSSLGKYCEARKSIQHRIYNFSDGSLSGNHLSSLLASKSVGISSKHKDFKTGLVKILIKAFGLRVLLSYFFKFVADSLQFVSAFLLKELIDFVSDRDKIESQKATWFGYMLVVAMLVASWLHTVFYHQHLQLAMTSGMRMKTALMAAIYRKSLCINTNDSELSSTRKLENLMSVDCRRVQDLMNCTWMLWSIPYQMGLAIFLIWNTLGASVLASIGLLMLFVPISILIGYHQQKLQKVSLSLKDDRVQVMREVLSGIKALKLYAWEEIFLRKIKEVRKQEMSILTKIACLNVWTILMWTCGPYLICLVSIGTYVLMSSSVVLTPQMAVVTLTLCNILQFPVAFIPDFVSAVTQASVAVRMIAEFLSQKEPKRNCRHHCSSGFLDSEPYNSKFAVVIENGLFAWNPTESFILHNVNIQIPRGSLVAVVGHIGSGKTSFLSSILGEMEKLDGEVMVEGSTVYVPQSAWIQNASIQQNILFGSKSNDCLYKVVIQACALEQEFMRLPGGDLTEIGEKGFNLSEDQKQRISLARALYSDAEIYILDNPLSAVDSAVGNQFFKRVISNRGFLRSKTRIMVTHALQWLSMVDEIIFIQDGFIAEIGSYNELIMKDGQLTKFLQTEHRKEFDEKWLPQDDEVKNMKQMISGHLDSASSCTESITSVDEATYYHVQKQKRLSGKGASPVNEPDSMQYGVECTDVSIRDIAHLTQKESLDNANVTLGVYGKYCKSVGYCLTGLILALFTAYQVSNALANLCLAKWTRENKYLFENATVSKINSMNMHYLKTFGILGAFQVFFICIYAFLISIRMINAAAHIHNSILSNVMGATMSFFDSNLMEKILNRFSRDVENVDNVLPRIILMFTMCLFSVVSALTIISIQVVLFTAMIIPLMVAYLTVERFYLQSSTRLKRLETVYQSPIFSQFCDTLNGSRVIRGFQRSRYFVMEFYRRINKGNSFYFAAISADRWLGVWIEFTGSLVLLVSSIFLLIKPGVDGASMGIVVMSALQITHTLKWIVQSLSDIEANSVSLERVYEYTELPQELSRVSLLNIPIPLGWPRFGEIIFHQVTTRYRRDLDPVLKDVSFVIRPGEKVGIVGRMGSGKSSLTLSLLRILELDKGDIIVDNVNIKDVDLPLLRSSIAILPQEPVLFSGTIRLNLDPKGQYSDTEIWRALNLANLKNTVASTVNGLDTEVGSNGSRLSMSQKHLLCLARALLKPTSILVIDEPKHSMDPGTDWTIHRTLSKTIRGITTIIISKNIDTIISCDRVMVLERGQVIEFDQPLNLLKYNSHFATLARDAGIRTFS